MAVLGTPCRVVYESKDFRTGLTDVVAVVKKSNNSNAGPYPMAEMPSPFQGRYYFDLITTTSDPAGEWTVLIVSPTDGIQTTKELSLYPPVDISSQVAQLAALLMTLSGQIDDISAALITIETAAGDITAAATTVEQAASDLQVISRTIVSAVVPALITGGVSSNKVQGEIKDNTKLAGSQLKDDTQLSGTISDEGVEP